MEHLEQSLKVQDDTDVIDTQNDDDDDNENDGENSVDSNEDDLNDFLSNGDEINTNNNDVDEHDLEKDANRSNKYSLIPVDVDLTFSAGYDDDPESIHARGEFKFAGRIPFSIFALSQQVIKFGNYEGGPESIPSKCNCERSPEETHPKRSVLSEMNDPTNIDYEDLPRKTPNFNIGISGDLLRYVEDLDIGIDTEKTTTGDLIKIVSYIDRSKLSNIQLYALEKIELEIGSPAEKKSCANDIRKFGENISTVDFSHGNTDENMRKLMGCMYDKESPEYQNIVDTYESTFDVIGMFSPFIKKIIGEYNDISDKFSDFTDHIEEAYKGIDFVYEE